MMNFYCLMGDPSWNWPNYPLPRSPNRPLGGDPRPVITDPGTVVVVGVQSGLESD